MKIRFVVLELLHVERRTDKLIRRRENAKYCVLAKKLFSSQAG
jgi:hypothetical protein